MITKLGAIALLCSCVSAQAATVLFENSWTDPLNPGGGGWCNPCGPDPNGTYDTDQDTAWGFELQHDAFITGVTFLTTSDPAFNSGDLGTLGYVYHPGEYTKTDIGNGLAEISLTFPDYFLPEKHFAGAGVGTGAYWFGVGGVNGGLSIIAGVNSYDTDGNHIIDSVIIYDNVYNEVRWSESAAFRLTGRWANEVATVPLRGALPLLAGAIGLVTFRYRRRRP